MIFPLLNFKKIKIDKEIMLINIFFRFKFSSRRKQYKHT